MRVFHMSLLLVACCLVRPATADVAYESTRVGQDDVQVVRMTVTPAAEPVPALRHRLIARDIDLKAGNAAPFYYRAIAELSPTMKRVREKFDEEKELSNWYGLVDATPIAKLPLDKVRDVNQMFDSIYAGYLLPAFARNDCAWQLGIEDLHGVDTISFLLPEFQESRQIARLLVLRTRLAIAERRYGDAIETMQQQYRLGGDVAKVPFIVCGLIGIAIDGVANGTMLELIANPDSPNMYWALAQLPQPLIDMRAAARFELDIGPRIFGFIHHAETTEHAPEEWNRLYTQAMRDLGTIGGGSGKYELFLHDPMEEARVGFMATGLALGGYSHAKDWLINRGMARERVERMAVGQVMAIYSERIYQRFADDFEKCWYVPFADMPKIKQRISRRFVDSQPFGTGENREVLPIASQLMPALQAARGAQVRLERDVAALRVIEALRMYAADHSRQLPKSLDEITAVPVPLNPATGKPFVYRLDGKTAVLELPSSDGIPGGRRYEIQIAEK